MYVRRKEELIKRIREVKRNKGKSKRGMKEKNI